MDKKRPMPPTPPKKPFNLGRFSKTLSFWILVILIPVAFIQFSSNRSEAARSPVSSPRSSEILQ